MKKALYALAGFALGIITAPLFVIAWPAVFAWFLASEADECGWNERRN